MTDTSATLSGALARWPDKQEMAAILRRAGLNISVGVYSVSVNDCNHFVFQQYGGDLGEPAIDADAESATDMLHDGKLVSDALSMEGIRHRFEIYDYRSRMVGYLHYNWPIEEPL
jgi:hypothetical protein